MHFPFCEGSIGYHVPWRGATGARNSSPSFSIAGVCPKTGRFSDIYALIAEASRVKKECKLIPGSKHIIA